MSALSPEPDVSRLRDSLHNLMACRSALLTGPALQELSHVIKTRRRPQDVLEDTANRVRNDDGSLPDNWDSQQILRNSDDELQTAEDDIRNARAEVQGRLDAFWAAESEVRGAIDALDEETANALCEHYHAGWLTRLTRSIDTIIEPIRFSAPRNGHPADVSVVLTALWHNQTLLPQEEPPLSELMQDLASLRFAPQQQAKPATAAESVESIPPNAKAKVKLPSGDGQPARTVHDDPIEIVASDDCRSAQWNGDLFEFSPTQAGGFECLLENWLRGTPTVAQETILEAAGSLGSRLKDVFDKGNHRAWGTLILAGTPKGTFRLAPAPPSKNLR